MNRTSGRYASPSTPAQKIGEEEDEDDVVVVVVVVVVDSDDAEEDDRGAQLQTKQQRGLNTIQYFIIGREGSPPPPPKRPLSQKGITWTVPVDATRPRARRPRVRGVGEDDQSDRCCYC